MTLQRYPPSRIRPPAVVRAFLRLGRALAALIATGVLAVLVAGVPYGLWHWIGWPLPHRVPTTAQIKDTLTGPFTDRILLDTLACLCWLIWAVFLTDLAQALPDTLRDARQMHTAAVLSAADRQSGPLRGLAALLLATILAGLLSLRPHPASAARSTAPFAAPRPGIVATALQMARGPVPISAAPIPGSARTAVVQPPHDGIHDSLWRIAQRHLGDGARWPEIYQLNKGHPQPDGGTLTMPSLIKPGWVLRLPTGSDTKSPPSIHPAPTAPQPHPPTASTSPALPAPPSVTPQPTHATPAPTTPASAHETPAVRTAGSHHGVDLGGEVYVSLGLASAVSAALVVARRRRRRFYIPGSGRRDDLPVAPVVRSLHLAHLRATTSPLEDDDLEDEVGDAEEDSGAWDRTGVELGNDPKPDLGSHPGNPNWHAMPRSISAESGQAGMPALSAGSMRELPAGIAAGQLMATDLAALQGLGLVGPGAHDAARALILHLITATDVSGGPVVLVPNQDAAILQLPGEQRLPARLRIVADLDAALDDAETAILRRARQAATLTGPPATSNGTESGVVVVASAPADQRRLQAILDITTSNAPDAGGESGSVATAAAILLGQWRSGASLYVAADGTVTATNPGPAEPLRGARLFHLPAPHTADLLDLLRAADTPRDDPGQLATPVTFFPDEQSAPAARRFADAPAATEPPEQSTSRLTPLAEPSAPTSTQGQNLHGGPAPTDAAGKAAGTRTSTVLDERCHDEDKQPDAASLRLAVFGPLRLLWSPITDTTDTGTGRIPSAPLDITGAFSPRLRELLVLLALHPDGITRDRLADTLWPDTPAGRPFATLNKNLARLRRTVIDATDGRVRDLVVTAGDRHQLDPDVVAVDFRAFSDAVTSRRTAVDDEQRIAAYHQITAAYRGELADGLTAEWLETPREAARRDAVDAATSLARLLIPTDSRAALDQLEMARSFDPFNEAIYRDIMKVQRRLGQSDAIERTFALLTIRLAELQETPEPETVALVRRPGEPVG